MKILKSKFFKLVVIFVLSFSSIFGGTKEYIASADGFGGDIQVKVSLKENKLTDIKILKNSESEFTKPAFENIIQDVINTQSVDVDDIAGATYTSKGLKKAIKKAIFKSKIELVKIKKVEQIFEDTKTDIVIIGGGGAGLTAAISAAEKGAKIILIEKMPMLGGNTNYATGGLNAANTSIQKLKGVEDSEELFVQDTMKGGKNKNNIKLVEKMAYKSKDIIEWLAIRGADLSDLGRLAGQNKDRTHRPLGGSAVGPNIVMALSETANKLNLDIRLNQKAINLLEKNGEIIGVEILLNSGKKYNIYSKSVIITTGGFGANFDMVSELVPELKGFGTTNQKGALGEGVVMLNKIGADMVDLNQIQTHPTVVPSNSEMITEAVRGNGAILVNRDGKRFVNELETRDVVSKAELSQNGGTAYLVFDQGVRKSLKAIEKYNKSGLLTRGKNIEELAKKLNIPYLTFKESIEKYNEFVILKNDKEFSRENMQRELNQGPFYAVEVGPAIHHTMGGVKINEETAVLRNNKVIPGLYAAGEVTGGIHGANRLGGNAMTDITVFGKIAGEAAAKFSESKK